MRRQDHARAELPAGAADDREGRRDGAERPHRRRRGDARPEYPRGRRAAFAGPDPAAERRLMTSATSAAFRSVIGDAESRAERRAPGEDLKVVLFSGGSGASSICESLLKSRHVSLTILINAYDDGHST